MITIDKISTRYHLLPMRHLLMDYISKDGMNAVFLCDALAREGAMDIEINGQAGIIAFSLFCQPDALPPLDTRVQGIRDLVIGMLLSYSYRREQEDPING